jgi:outer membrane protein assembly factor BamB
MESKSAIPLSTSATMRCLVRFDFIGEGVMSDFVVRCGWLKYVTAKMEFRRNRFLLASLLGLACCGLNGSVSQAEDWSRFRGPDGSGVAGQSETIPATWSANANLGWKTELPGPGASSPIVVGGKVFVTCYSGYGLSVEEPGEISNLVRHLVCVDLKSGRKLWQQDVPAELPEDPYTGVGVPAHGYASHTPVSDGKVVIAFFGKAGVFAYDMEGKKLWQAEVGKESDPARWGSSSSPIIFEDTVIITASCESQSIMGLNKATGEELWRQEAKGLDNMWGTPTLVKVDNERTDLVMCVAKELWGLDPHTGKMRWYADATGAEHAYSSIVLDGKRVYAFTSRGGGSIAVDAGGSGDISKTNTVWTGRDNASFASPVRYKSKLYVVAGGIINVVDAETGKQIQRLRLKATRPTGGRFGSLDYPSPIVVADHLYYLNGSGQMFVFDLRGEKLHQVALNEVTQEREMFCGTPAVADHHLVMRSAKYLYCVVDKGHTVDQKSDLLAKASDPEEPEPAANGGAGGQGRPGGRGGQQFDPQALFAQLDSNKDGNIAADELEGNRMAERLMTLDKDEDQIISKDEFTSGITALFSRGPGEAGGGRGASPPKPDRPQRPEMAGEKA